MTKPATHDTHAVIFNKGTGPALMALPDARDAVRRFPETWSFGPFTDQPQDSGRYVNVPSDFAELGEMERRSIAAQIWRDMADRPMAEVDAALGRRYAIRFDAAAELSVPR